MIGNILFWLAVLILGAFIIFFTVVILQMMYQWEEDKPKITIKFFFDFLTNKTGGFQMETSIQAKVGKKFYGHIDPRDIDNFEVPFDEGTEVFSSSDESIATVVTNPKNPKYFIGTLTGKVGDVKVQVKFDADVTSGEVLVSDFATVHVTPDLAVSAGMVFDETDDAPDTRSFTDTDFSDGTNAIVVHQQGAIPAVGETVTVNGAPIVATAETTFTLSNGATLVVGADSLVVSYTAAA